MLSRSAIPEIFAVFLWHRTVTAELRHKMSLFWTSPSATACRRPGPRFACDATAYDGGFQE